MGVKLHGVSKFSTALKRLDRKLKAEANKAVAGAALRTVGVAKMRITQVDLGALRNSINHTHDANTISAAVFAGNIPGKKNYAAYVEFGTGEHAAAYVPTLDPEFQKLARTFFVNGRGKTKTSPYLIPAYLQEGKRLTDKLKNLKVDW